MQLIKTLVASDHGPLSEVKLYHVGLYYIYTLDIGYSSNSQTVLSGSIVLAICDSGRNVENF